jgi:RNA polymerase sigma factor (sigma-70 family)
MEIDIDQLPSRLRKPDQSAYGDFAATFGPRLRRYFLTLGSCAADAEALAVTCLTDIALKADRFQARGPGHFERWVFVVARNAWVDERRRRVGALSWEVAFRDGATGEPADDDSTAARDDDVAAAMEELPEVDRTILALRYFKGVESFAEVGEQVGLSEAAARVRHHRALKKLFLSLAAYGPRDRAAAASQEVRDDD